MRFMVIAGDAATGKMTVGQEIVKRTDFRLFHNHVTIEPVIEVLGYYDSKVTQELRDVFFRHLAESQGYGVIFTCMYAFDLPGEKAWLDGIVSLFRESAERLGTAFEFYFVELNAGLDTRLERNATENRLIHKPSKRDIALSNQRLLADSRENRFISYEGEVQYENYMRIVNDDISPEQQAEMVIKLFGIPYSAEYRVSRQNRGIPVMFGERYEHDTLLSGQCFRWGGFDGLYDRTAKEWQQDFFEMFGDEKPNPYKACVRCKKPFADNDGVYSGAFKVDRKGNCMFCHVCRACAYEISDTVLEADGRAYKDITAYRQSDES